MKIFFVTFLAFVSMSNSRADVAASCQPQADNDRKLLSAVQNSASLNDIKNLLLSGANPSVCDQQNVSALMKTSLQYGTYEYSCNLAHLLMDAGADVNAVDKNSENILFYALDEDGCIASEALSRGASVQIQNKDGQTLLMKHLWSPLAVKELIMRGADVNKQDQANFTALMHTSLWCEKLPNRDEATTVAFPNGPIKYSFSDIAKLLIQAGAKLDLQTGLPSKMSALMFAVQSCPNLAQTLIEAGADVTLKDSDGRSAYSWLQVRKWKSPEKYENLKKMICERGGCN